MAQFKKGMTPHNKLVAPPKAELKRLYLQEELTSKQIGKRYNVTGTTVLNWLERYGIERRRQRNQSGWNPEPDVLRRLYWDEWMSYEQVADVLGVDFTAIPYWLDRFGIPKRTIWETRRGPDWQEPDIDTICHLYEAEKMGMRSIGQIFDVSKVYVKRVLNDNGIDIRRDGYPNVGHYTAKDGHRVKSGLEVQADNWLYDHGIEHIYEPPIGETRYKADFLVQGQYIEIWGIQGNEQYDRKRAKKCKVYERLQLPLISVYRSDFPHLDVFSVLLS